MTRAYAQPVESLPVEHLYPGWHGLAEGADAVATSLVTGRYRPYDWHAGTFGAEVSLHRERPLVVEGCGALSRANLDAARDWADGPVWGVWVECPAEVRRARALARDGDMYRPHWDSWAEQEAMRIDREQPLAYAHHIIHTYAHSAARVD